ncbi:MAG: ABC transporter permease, partial [Bryobacteraceae bacterium]
MPDWKSLVRERIAALRLEPSAEESLVEEFAQHLEACYRERRSGGASDEEACRIALSELDDVYPMRAEFERSGRLSKNDPVRAGDVKSGNFLEDVWRDLRYALRTMRKSPLFVLFVVFTLGLGIGANTTVFTVIDTLILNPLPVRHPAELAAVVRAEAKTASQSGAPLPISYADLRDYQARNGVFSSLAGYTSPQGVTWQTGVASQGMFSELVTGNYFSTLGLSPVRGRFFVPEEDDTPGAHAVAVMNYGTWQARFGGADDIVGKTLRVNGVVVTVIGVGPRQFIGVNAIFGPDLWIPAAMAERLLPNQMQTALSDRGKMIFHGVGRLRP